MNFLVTICIILGLSLSLLLFGCRKDVSRENTGKTTKSDSNDIRLTRSIEVKCDLRVEKVNNDFFAVITFTNNSDQAVSMKKRNLLMNGEMEWAAFVLFKDGTEVSYTGINIYCLPSKMEEYYLLKTGATLTSKIKLLDYYDIATPGHYTIRYGSFNATVPKEYDAFVLTSNTVEFDVE